MKRRLAGLDDFLKSTENREEKKQREKKPDGEEKLTLLNFQLTASLKKRISRYCLENDTSIRDFLTALIEEHLKQQEHVHR